MALHRYQLGEPLGVGGMGSVLAATRTGDDAPLAIKLLSGIRAQSIDAREDFAHEIWSLARLDHPGIVGVIDWGVVDAADLDPDKPALFPGTPYLVMERAEGHLNRSRYPVNWDELVPIVQDILAALAHAHARNVVHRDLKPSNVLRSHDARWKLADFGIAHAMDRHAADGKWGRTVGTPAYMAPEQISGQWRDFGPWTDLYAVGVLVYELVSGVTPFPTLTSKELLTAVLEHPIPAPEHPRFPVPEGFEGWLARLLERNFLDRAQRAADVGLWLEQLGRPRSLDSALPMADGPGMATTRTMPLDAFDTGPVERRTLPEGPAPDPLPRRPVPADWRPLEAVATGPAPLASSIPRALPFTGRVAERDRIWDALRQVDRGDGAHAVILRGAPGSGRTALGRWVLERAHELGAAWQLVATHHDPQRPLDGIGAMFATFLRSVDLEREALLERLRFLLQLREGGGGLEHVVVELMAPSDPSNPGPTTFGSVLERNAAALGALQLLTGVLGADTDTAPRRNVVALLDDVHEPHAAEALGLVQLALANRTGLRTPILFVLTADADAGDAEPALQALEALDGAHRIDLPRLPEEVQILLDQLPPLPGVEHLRAEVGPPTSLDPETLEQAIRDAITGTGTRTTTDGL